MAKFKKINLFIYNRVFGLFLLFLFVFSTLSIFTYSENDPFYGSLTSNNNTENIFGVLGSYFVGTSFVFFSYLTYLFPIFFLIIGFKKLFGFSTRFLILRFLAFFFGILLSCFLLVTINIDGGMLGIFIYNLFENNFNYILNNSFYFALLEIVLFLVCFVLLIYGTSFQIKRLNKIIIFVFKNMFLIFKIFKIHKLFFSFKNIFSSNLSIRKNKRSLNIEKRKTEPTINSGDKTEKKYFYNSNKVKEHLNLDNGEYVLPPFSLLKLNTEKRQDLKELEKLNSSVAEKLEEVLKQYGVIGKINNFKTGPIITLFEFLPAPGIKTSKVVGLAEDIARSMSSMSARISSQPGKSAIGIEIPNKIKNNVYLGDLLGDEKFDQKSKGLLLALGKTISGEKKFTDLERMPHLLIAGTTGSGKSVGINCMILSLLFRFKPSECKLILIDPKMLELSVYADIPHLLTPVVTDPKKAVFALKWVVREMENRYRLMSSAGVKSIQSFNNKIESCISSGKKLLREVQTGIDPNTRIPIIEKQEIPLEKMPLIVVVVDEMADLMMVAGKEVEHLIQRLAQMARASGIHLITATQRPSVDVITGTIKANFPSRISFRVASRFDSRTILNEMGAEQLLGSGDMLFLENGANLMRLHGGYVSEKEIEEVVKFINGQSTNEEQFDITSEVVQNSNELNFDDQSKNVDELYQKAVSIVLKQQKASTSFIQRYLQIGYNRAARIIEQMEEDGIVSEANHVGKRSVLKKDS